MKIIHITPSYKPAYLYGGPIHSIAKLCEAIAIEAQPNGIDLEVFTTTANGKTELQVDTKKPMPVDGVCVTYFKRLTKDHSHFSPQLLLNLSKVIRKERNNQKIVIHIHAWWNLVSLFSCFIAKWHNVPVVLSPRGMLTTYSQNNRNSLFKRLIHNTIGQRLLKYCHIHATSLQEVEDIELIFKPKSINVIHNLVQISPRPKNDARLATIHEQRPFRLIFLSRLEEKKGLELLFEALANLSISWSLTIGGSGEEKYVESLKQKAIQLKLEDRIKWIGQVSNQDKFPIMAGNDLLLLTSYNENFANVVIESLSVGTPVLISNRVGLSEYVRENDLGWITSLDSEEIVKLLSSAAENHEKRSLIRKEAPTLIKKDFNDTNLVEKYLTLYQNTAN